MKFQKKYNIFKYIKEKILNIFKHIIFLKYKLIIQQYEIIYEI